MVTFASAVWQVRINARNGKAIGEGILIDPLTVLTCACVVRRLRAEISGAISSRIAIDFPGSNWERRRRSAAISMNGPSWAGSQQGGGPALLTLAAAPPDDVYPAALALCGRLNSGSKVNIFGYPPGTHHGVWGQARLVDETGQWPARMRLEADEANGPAMRWCTGAGALDDSGSVIGLVLAEWEAPHLGAGWLVPTEMLMADFPGLSCWPAHDRTPDRTVGTAQPAPLAVQRLAAALQNVSVMRDASTRHAVIRTLRSEISGNTPRHPSTLHDIHLLVRTCLDYPGGLSELMSSIRHFVGAGSEPVRQVEQLIFELGLWGR